MATEKKVRDKIRDNDVMMFSKSYCPFCAKAKQLLDKYIKGRYEVWEIDEVRETDAIQNVLNKLTGARSVPRVFVKGKFIGGADDLQAQDSKRKLEGELLGTHQQQRQY